MIKEIVKEKKEWVDQYDDHPYEYWKRRWDYLCRRLSTHTDMERQLRHRDAYYPKAEKPK
tara:strand:+ start:2235 stop:2414 length:180 start_codon:yes stop_codon:yes gene_type:complete